jgi:hypothetical protein
MPRFSPLIALFALGCGSTAVPAPAPTPAPPLLPAAEPAPPPEAATEAEIPSPEAEPVSTALEVPNTCAQSNGPCTPGATFAKALCEQPSPDLALTMFTSKSPWTRAYVRVPMDAWYTGGRHNAPSRLDPGEEVIIVATHGAAGEIQVGGASYDVYRWDGKCVSVMADEVTLKKPRTVTVAPIVWRRLDERVQERLLSSRDVARPHTLMRRECKSDSSQPSCLDAQIALSLSIANYVRNGGELPAPE